MRSYELLWVGIVVMLIIMAVVFSITEAADLPEYADLTFVDQCDLDARVDSVLGVCHTDSLYYLVDGFGNPDWQYYPVCRRWAGLTVWNMPDSSRSHSNIIIRDSVDYDWEDPDGTRWRAHLWDQHPGNARLWWWEKEE